LKVVFKTNGFFGMNDPIQTIHPTFLAVSESSFVRCFCGCACPCFSLPSVQKARRTTLPNLTIFLDNRFQIAC
jgi:hypothetical protein